MESRRDGPAPNETLSMLVGRLTPEAMREARVLMIVSGVVFDVTELWLPRLWLADAVRDRPPAPDTEAAIAPIDADASPADSRPPLTRREAQIVEHLRQGSSNKEIARSLGIMEDTVKKHLQNVFGKLGVHRRSLVVLRPGGAPSIASPRVRTPQG